MLRQDFKPLYDDFDQDQDELEMLEIQLQMKRLNAVDARFECKRGFEKMKRELHEKKTKKQRIRYVKGKRHPFTHEN